MSNSSYDFGKGCLKIWKRGLPPFCSFLSTCKLISVRTSSMSFLVKYTVIRLISFVAVLWLCHWVFLG